MMAIALGICLFCFGFCLALSVSSFIYGQYVPGVINFLISLHNLAWVIYLFVKMGV